MTSSANDVASEIVQDEFIVIWQAHHMRGLRVLAAARLHKSAVRMPSGFHLLAGFPKSGARI